MAQLRKWLLPLLLLLTLLACAWVARNDTDQEVVSAVPKARRSPPPTSTGNASNGNTNSSTNREAAALDLSRLRQSGETEPAQADKVNASVPHAFSSKSFLPPPPPPPPPAKPVPPPAPPLPFAFAGRLQGDDGRWVFYLTRGDQSFSVTEGEEFDGSYRLQAVEKERLVIEYLPLATRQFLPLGTE